MLLRRNEFQGDSAETFADSCAQCGKNSDAIAFQIDQGNPELLLFE
jgi:hypothetical protein